MNPIHKKITDQILTNFKQAGSWKKVWSLQTPVSLNNHMYKGINELLLATHNYESPVWGTFNQICNIGGSVNRGQKAHLVVFWKKFSSANVDDAGKPVMENSFMLRYYNVFNAQQCSFTEKGQDKVKELAGVSEKASSERITSADEIIENINPKPIIIHGQYNPCYIPAKDEIRLPNMEQFHSPGHYYESLFHELIHWSGHHSRLARIKTGHTSNKHNYSKEELVAEIGSAFLCSAARVEYDKENTAAYIKSWISTLKNNPTWITWAASRAEKACSFLAPCTATTQTLFTD
jgi:antirestriction protein ArdC